MITRTMTIAAAMFLFMGMDQASAASWAEVKAKGAQAVVAAGDQNHNKAKTMVWHFKMTLKPVSGASRTMEFKVWQKGRTKRLVRFLSPGNIKGMSVLMQSPKVMYVYSPETDNARRVANHAKRQSFLGSDVSLSDMAVVDYAATYDASFGKETPVYQELVLNKKAGANVDWAKLKVRINKKSLTFSRIEYYAKGRLLKVQQRTRFSVWKGAPTYRRSTFIDMKTKHRTILDMLSQEINKPLPSSMFKKRALIRGN
jgi:hypothetical protein